jgi:hypothetical protein
MRAVSWATLAEARRQRNGRAVAAGAVARMSPRSGRYAGPRMSRLTPLIRARPLAVGCGIMVLWWAWRLDHGKVDFGEMDGVGIVVVRNETDLDMSGTG